MNSAERLRGFHNRLFAAYGPQHWWPAETPLEVILGAYLIQNTSWRSAERALANLRSVHALSLDALRALSVEELAELIRPAGFFTRKAPAILAFVRMLDDEFSGSLAQLAAQPHAALRKRLLQLSGVGPETADAIALYALGHVVPVADEYLRRIVERHALIAPEPQKNRSGYEAMAGLMRAAFSLDPPEDHAALYNELHALVVAVGKAHCGRTASCAGCPLAFDLQPAHSTSPHPLRVPDREGTRITKA